MASTIVDTEDCDILNMPDEFTATNNTVQTEYAALYKSLDKHCQVSQAERREKFLEEIRQKRNAVIDEKRNLNEDVNERLRRKKSYKNKLTFTEWFTDVPEDLEQSWVVKFCPAGKRSLIVAESYQTTCYNRKGDRICTFESNLPGGGPRSQRKKFTMLECLYNPKLKCYFVLDVLYWNSIPARHYDTEFRFYWLKSKFDESPELSMNFAGDEQIFHLLDYIPASPTLISQQLKEIPIFNGVPLPHYGLLFYHIESIYVSGYTPLVTWLKPFMVTELLGVPVNPLYLERMPEDYTTLKNHIKRLKKQHKKNPGLESKELDGCCEMEDSCADEDMVH